MTGWEDIAAEHNIWIPIKARGSASFSLSLEYRTGPGGSGGLVAQS